MESVKNLINQNEEKLSEQMKSMNSKLQSEIQSSLNCVDLLKKYESSIQADLNQQDKQFKSDMSALKQQLIERQNQIKADID